MICGESSKELNKIWLAVLIRAVFLFVLYMGYSWPIHLTMYNQSQGQIDFGRLHFEQLWRPAGKVPGDLWHQLCIERKKIKSLNNFVKEEEIKHKLGQLFSPIFPEIIQNNKDKLTTCHIISQLILNLIFVKEKITKIFLNIKMWMNRRLSSDPI